MLHNFAYSESTHDLMYESIMQQEKIEKKRKLKKWEKERYRNTKLFMFVICFLLLALMKWDEENRCDLKFQNYQYNFNFFH